MGMTSDFKRYERNRRQASIETDFSKGMMFHSGAIDEGYVKTLVNYNISSNTSSLVPRPGLRTTELLLPDIAQEYTTGTEYHSDESILIKAAKECVETDEKTYRQIILGKADESGKTGKLYVVTSEKADVLLTDTNTTEEGLEYEIKVAIAQAEENGMSCTYFTTELPSIHNMEMLDDVKVATIVGTFAFGNSFYFFNAESKALYKTVFDTTKKKYVFEAVTAKEIDPSEAVTYGYNMLQGEQAYSFVNRNLAGTMQLTGILPYSTKGTGDTLLMTPRKNEEIYFRCYFKGEVGQKYKFTWEWRNTSDSEWTSIENLTQATEYEIVANDNDTVSLKSGTEIIENLQITFKAPAEDIMIRVQAYNSTDYTTVEKAMTVGFDFTTETYGTATNVKAEVYNLSEAAGMTTWKNRLVLWGIPKDPTILFLSDVNEPSYFPYPNNVSVYDESVVACHEYLDTLLIFTTSKIYQVSAGEDGATFTSTLIQSNLNIEPWDRHLIQIVKNMVFFKSGNYYFMIVPKAQSTTGQLTLAPVSTSMVDFFNHFEKNVYDLIKDTFDYEGVFDLVNYYNFLDYEDVHNIYVLDFPDDNDVKGYLHLDILYNTVSRTWKIYTFEAPHFLYPYKHDATQTGTLAATSLNEVAVKGYRYNDVNTIKNVYPSDNPVYNSLTCSFPKNLKLSDFMSGELAFYDIDDNVILTWNLIDCDITIPLGNAIVIHDEEMTWEVKYSFSGMLTIQLYDTSRVAFGNGVRVRLYNLRKSVEVAERSFCTPVWFIEDTDSEYSSVSGMYNPYSNPWSVALHGSKVLHSVEEATDGSDTLVCPDLPYLSFKYEKPSIGVEGWSVYVDPDKLDTREIDFSTASQFTLYIGITAQTLAGVSARCIQLLRYDSLILKDLYLPSHSYLVYAETDLDSGYDLSNVEESLKNALKVADKQYFFKNWQFVDTGYRNDNTHLYKRYRELQFQINNIEGENLYFGLEFLLNGENRLSYYTYDVEHVTDMNNPDYGLIYIQPQAQANLPLEYVGTVNETKLGPDTNMWVLNQSLFPDLSFWKIRMPVSGKGIVPRMRLMSRNQVRYELLGINWIYRTMNMR